MTRGAEKLGLHPRPGFMAINSVPYDGRPACIQCGFCFQGCIPRAKWSTLYEAIPKAEATGKLDLRPSSQALKVTLSAPNTVRGVLYVDELGRQQEQRARVVVVAGNSIETARLLLNSWTPAHPQGLANSSGQVGRNYMFHNSQAVLALSKEENPTVFQKTLGLNDFYFGMPDFEYPMGNIQMVGKSQAPMFRGEKPGETKLAPGWWHSSAASKRAPTANGPLRVQVCP